jgi:hypothetical protein
VLAALLRPFTGKWARLSSFSSVCFPEDGDSNFGFAVNATHLIAVNSDTTLIRQNKYESTRFATPATTHVVAGCAWTAN